MHNFHLSNPLAKQPPSYARRKDYRMGRIIGEGGFGIVRLAQWRVPKPPITVAVKVIPKRMLKGASVDQVHAEAQILKDLQHPNIVRLYDYFESKGMFSFVDT